MKIGIVDDGFFSLQARLLKEGHTLVVLVDGCPPLPEDAFNVTDVRSYKGRLIQVHTAMELIESHCDYYICGTVNQPHIYSMLTALTVAPTSGYLPAITQLEHDRDYARSMCLHYGLDKHFDLPESHTFTSRGDLVRFLKSSRKKWVIKPAASSPHAANGMRTFVIDDNKSFADSLPKNTAWFSGESGGAILESFVSGLEVSFGAWFNGHNFVMPFYSYIEHKGACNGDRGNILTGEVGTTMKFHPESNSNSLIHQTLRALEPMLEGKCNGMIDLNFILDEKTKRLTLLEFTPRFGRPTLEMMVALSKGNNLGNGIYDLIYSNMTSTDLFSDKFSVGVSVYSYGNPIIEHLIELAPNEEIQEYIKETSMVQSKRFDMPKIPKKYKYSSQVLPITTLWKEGKFVSNLDDRHFISIGMDSTPSGAIESAYAPLQKFNVHGFTWRDDIGHSLDYTTATLRQLGYV